MSYNPNKHHRRSIRLKGYDYSQEGLYFITICVKERAFLFGKIGKVENPCGCPEMILNDAGRMVENEWLKIPQRFPNVHLHAYVVMPNHFHAIMEIVWATLVVARNDEPVQPEPVQTDKGQPEPVQPEPVQTEPVQTEKGQPQGFAPTKPKTVGDMVGAFQSIVTVEYIRGVKQLGWATFNGKLWQRNYWEHIIRDEQSYHRISEYIINNPKNWNNDKLNGK